MSFDIDTVLSSYAPSDAGKRQALRLMDIAGFKNDRDTLGIIGLGGTISSGYSYAAETIVPGSYAPAAVTLKSLQDMFGVVALPHATIDLSAKDSRQITESDIHDLLDFIDAMHPARVLITCGTYMLPRVAEIIARAPVGADKTIALTGSMLPQGFVHSDAPANIIGALAALDMAAQFAQAENKNVFIHFHGRIFNGLVAIRSLDLHPASSQNVILVSPQASIPVLRK